MTMHECNWKSPWPTGHPLPPENPDRLTGPEVGAIMVLPGKSYASTWIDGERVPEPKRPDRTVRVIARSYVWSPGECRANGGYRHYNWSVIEDVSDPSWHIVVNDTDLEEVPVHGYTDAQMSTATSRGWESERHFRALEAGDEDAIGLTHPFNYLTEDEVERS
jgi:hypothetical protein